MQTEFRKFDQSKDARRSRPLVRRGIWIAVYFAGLLAIHGALLWHIYVTPLAMRMLQFSEPVQPLGFTNDGRRLVAIDNDGKGTEFPIDPGPPILKLPDNRCLSTFCNQGFRPRFYITDFRSNKTTRRNWNSTDRDTNEPADRSDAQFDRFGNMQTSPDFRFCAANWFASGQVPSFRLFDLSTGRQTYRIDRREHWAEFSHDGRFCALFHVDVKAVYWAADLIECATGRSTPLMTSNEKISAFTDAWFSPRDNRLAVATFSPHGPELRAFACPTAKVLFWKSCNARDVSFSHDEQLMAVAHVGGIEVWTFEGRVLLTIAPNPKWVCHFVEFSVDDERLVAGPNVRRRRRREDDFERSQALHVDSIREYDVATGRLLREMNSNKRELRLDAQGSEIPDGAKCAVLANGSPLLKFLPAKNSAANGTWVIDSRDPNYHAISQDSSRILKESQQGSIAFNLWNGLRLPARSFPQFMVSSQNTVELVETWSMKTLGRLPEMAFSNPLAESRVYFSASGDVMALQQATGRSGLTSAT